jgi:hypothetical protein
VQPLLLVFEDLHWIDSETQAVLDSLLGSLPMASLLLLVNYRPEYHHDWGGKTYYPGSRGSGWVRGFFTQAGFTPMS